MPAIYTEYFAATLSTSGSILSIHWYTGVFKKISLGLMRAVSRTISNFITQKQSIS